MDFHKEIEQVHIYRKQYGAKPNRKTLSDIYEKFQYKIIEKSEGKPRRAFGRLGVQR